MNKFIENQRYKFNMTHDFHDVFIENGWHGKETSPEPDIIPYKKYTQDNGIMPVLVSNYSDDNLLITSIDNQQVEIRCRDAFDCYVHLVMNGNELAAAQQVSNLIPDNYKPFNTGNFRLIEPNDLVSYNFFNLSSLVISPIESETYPDKSIQRLVPSDVHGSAQWKTVKEIRASGLISDIGIPLGIVPNENGVFEKISYTGGKHLLTIAPSGTGKNSAVQIPVLLQYDAPIFCIDPKAENALVTARYRKEVMGHDVFVINPFGICADRFEELGIPQVGFNPLASLNIDDKDFVTQVNAVCQLLIKEPIAGNNFFEKKAKELIACLIMYICKTKPAEERNLLTVMRLLMQNPDELLTVTLPIIASDDFKPMAERADLTKIVESSSRAMAEKARSFLSKNIIKTIENVISTATSELGFLHDGYLEDSLSSYGENNIDFSTLRQTKHKNITVYLIVPIHSISLYQTWFRMVIHTALTLFSTAHKTDTKRVLVMVDECKAIGYLPSLEDSLVYARGFGIQIWCFFQDYGQIEQIYQNPDGFFANVDIQQFFTVNDPKTAKIVSNRIGQRTVLSRSANYHPSGQMQSFSQNETRQPSIEANELYGQDISHQIIFSFGVKNPIGAVKDYYFNNPILKERADWNPYAPK